MLSFFKLQCRPYNLIITMEAGAIKWNKEGGANETN